MPGSFTFMVRFVAATLLLGLFAGCGDKSTSSADGTNTGNGNPLDAPGDYLKSAVKAQRDATMLVDTNSLDKAISQFNIDKGRNPRDLNELVQERYIPKVPQPPHGTKITYDADSGRVDIVKE
jgi:hypothetical protein